MAGLLLLFLSIHVDGADGEKSIGRQAHFFKADRPSWGYRKNVGERFHGFSAAPEIRGGAPLFRRFSTQQGLLPEEEFGGLV